MGMAVFRAAIICLSLQKALWISRSPGIRVQGGKYGYFHFTNKKTETKDGAFVFTAEPW